MLELVAILVAIVVAFLALTWTASRYTARVFAAIAEQHGHDTDWIMESGLAPPSWCERQRRRVANLERRGATAEDVARVKERQRRVLVARLARHLRQLDRSDLFATERERRAVTKRVREVGRAWEASSWDDVVGMEDRT